MSRKKDPTAPQPDKNKIVKPKKPLPKRAQSKPASPIPTDSPSDFAEIDGKPPAWANSRGELADAMPWYKIVQGSMYHKDGLCWGFLLDRDMGLRSHVDDELVITRMCVSCSILLDLTLQRGWKQNRPGRPGHSNQGSR